MTALSLRPHYQHPPSDALGWASGERLVAQGLPGGDGIHAAPRDRSDPAGDSVLAMFETAAGAVVAAVSVQRQLAHAGTGQPEAARRRFRIGVHLGDVVEKPDGSVYGHGVNVAARLQALAMRPTA